MDGSLKSCRLKNIRIRVDEAYGEPGWLSLVDLTLSQPKLAKVKFQENLQFYLMLYNK